MLTFLEILFWTSVIIVFYIYLGYPILLWFLNRFIKKPVNRNENYLPSVTLIISAYNEEKVIREKINNTISLNYPKDKFEIIIVSDCSCDNTDEIIQEYVSEQLIHIKNEVRSGKTFGLNKAVSLASGEIVIFSDANALYNPDAVKKLIRNFSDHSVGYVVGEARYVKNDQPAGFYEDRYWNYEIYIKKKESAISSIVGGDGAIYAIRKELYETLKPTDINDFLNPLQIIRKGYRGVYEPEAICYEESTGDFKAEFNRKRRIIGRSLRAVFAVNGILNPFNVGLYAIQLISHKLLRWMIPFFLILILLSTAILGMESLFFKILFLFQIIFYASALVIHFIYQYIRLKSSILYSPYYFSMINLASLFGIYDAISGKIPSRWEPQRADNENNRINITTICWKEFIFIMTSFFTLLIVIFLSDFVAKTLFWVSLFTIIYVYIGYPIMLTIFANFSRKVNSKNEFDPSVTLLITAYNEEKVIEKKIKNSISMDYPKNRYKIVIASDGSDDNTNQIVTKFKHDNIQLFQFPKREGKIATINKVFPYLDSEVIVFSDANVMYKKDAIKQLVSNFNDPSVGGASGDVILLNNTDLYKTGESLYYKYERFLQQKESDLFSMIGADGAMYAIRRSLFSPPSNNIILDDFVVPMNINNKGYRIVYEPEAKAYEKSPNNLLHEFKRRIRIAAGAVQSIKQREGLPNLKQKKLLFEYISHKLLRWLLPFAFIFLFSSSIALIHHSSFYYWTLILQITIFIFAVVGLFYKKSLKILSVPFYFLMVNTADLIGILKGILNLQKSTWELAGR